MFGKDDSNLDTTYRQVGPVCDFAQTLKEKTLRTEINSCQQVLEMKMMEHLTYILYFII